MSVSDEEAHQRIEGGMDQVLFKMCVEEKVDKITHTDELEELRGTTKVASSAISLSLDIAPSKRNVMHQVGQITI